jgi:hypothetical protein
MHRLVASARHGVLGMLVVAATLAGPGVAAAAPARGVHIDPGTPAGKQYAIPLGQARSTGAPSHVAAAGSAQLFGAGITSSEPSAATHPTGAAGGRTTRRSAPSPAAGKPPAVKPAAVAIIPVRKLLGSGPGESSGVWWMLAAGALVLVLGGLGGAVLARRS